MAKDFIRLTANAGILISYHGKKILVDAMHNRYTTLFSSVPDDLLYDIAHGEEEFSEIDLLVYTHDHPDHYSREWTQEFLKHHPETHMVSPIGDFQGERITILDQTEESHTMNGIKIDCRKLLHEGKEFIHVANYGFRFEIDGFAITVLGDSGSENIPEIFAKADVACYNFPFVSVSRGRKMIEDMQPKRLVVYHLPFEEKDKNNYTRAALHSVERNRYENAIVLHQKNQKEMI